jgi:L-fucose isomerase-like protein
VEAVLNQTVMACGHVANAVEALADGSRRAVCVICAGLGRGAEAPMDPQPDSPNGYRCAYCKRVATTPVAFADATPDRDGYGNHYDGCRGWD